MLVNVALGRAPELLCLVVALFPLINQLRDFAGFYSIVPVVLLFVLGSYGYMQRGTLFRLVRSNGLLAALLVFLLLYYIASFIYVKSYDSNIRLIEFGLAVLCVYALMGDANHAKSALLGIAISGLAVALALLPHLDPEAGRLGIVAEEGQRFGNPITLGLPLALAFLGAIADQGRWLGLERHQLIRAGIMTAVVFPLVLSSSRISWVIVALASCHHGIWTPHEVGNYLGRCRRCRGSKPRPDKFIRGACVQGDRKDIQ